MSVYLMNVRTCGFLSIQVSLLKRSCLCLHTHVHVFVCVYLFHWQCHVGINIPSRKLYRCHYSCYEYEAFSTHTQTHTHACMHINSFCLASLRVHHYLSLSPSTSHSSFYLILPHRFFSSRVFSFSFLWLYFMVFSALCKTRQEESGRQELSVS